ncbi:MAG TPA: hypothetical protein VHL58_20560 [Thermoanaerobaculia bacterium]|nr:hypothetical protein [Thermoanaerobaculia bacterium]
MKDRKARTGEMKREIERQGGTTWSSGQLPEEMPGAVSPGGIELPMLSKEGRAAGSVSYPTVWPERLMIRDQAEVEAVF